MDSALLDEKLEGILLINKEPGRTSFSLIPKLRKIFNQKKIGHGGTLDPLATGVMVYLIGKNYTKTADTYLHQDKEYVATIRLGEERDSYDIDGEITHTSDLIPTLEEIVNALPSFNGQIDQIPPMFSAKKVGGKKLYELARKGEEITRKAKRVTLETSIISYEYPQLKIHVRCSSGTYIRSIAHDLGEILGCFGCIEMLMRTRSGQHAIEACFSEKDLDEIRPLNKLLQKG
ncbi:tRNA pseudouridine(55) synthase TruB [bacterium]|nr:tRNA pseudouridine(55) synthase TruB [bacterium]